MKYLTLSDVQNIGMMYHSFKLWINRRDDVQNKIIHKIFKLCILYLVMYIQHRMMYGLWTFCTTEEMCIHLMTKNVQEPLSLDLSITAALLVWQVSYSLLDKTPKEAPGEIDKHLKSNQMCQEYNKKFLVHLKFIAKPYHSWTQNLNRFDSTRRFWKSRFYLV